MINCGHGVALRAIEKQDCLILIGWRNDWKIRMWCRQADLISHEQQSAWHARVQNDSTIKMYLIVNLESGDALGACGLTSIDHLNRRAEFSLYIGPEYQRKGYARAALKTLLDHGFRGLNLNCIWGETFDGNPAAKMFESLGFQKEGTRREFYFKDGRYVDTHLFSFLSSDWFKRLPLRNEDGHESSCKSPLCEPIISRQDYDPLVYKT